MAPQNSEIKKLVNSTTSKVHSLKAAIFNTMALLQNVTGNQQRQCNASYPTFLPQSYLQRMSNQEKTNKFRTIISHSC